jgi:hypothetical protein
MAALACGARGTGAPGIASPLSEDASAPEGSWDGSEAGADEVDVPRDAGPEDDAEQPLVILPAQFTEEDMPMRMLSPGDPVDLWSAPQGGHVVLLGAKVKNLTSDTITLKVRFRDPDTGLIVAEEARTVKMLPVDGEPGVMQPDIRSRSQVSNVPLCPSYDSRGVVDQTFDVEVLVTALYSEPMESASATIRVVARCSTPEDEAACRCECGPDYVLGKCSGPPTRDANQPDAGDANSAPETSDAGRVPARVVPDAG